MKIGVIAVGMDCADVFDEIMNPWSEASKKHDISMCFVSSRFIGMEGLIDCKMDEPTLNKIKEYAKHNDKVSYVGHPGWVTEATARESGRKTLMEIGVDVIWLLDFADEYYTIQDIDKIIGFVERNPMIPWFKISLKNFVFTKNMYLADPFQPPRIWRTRVGHRVLYQCNYDNDFLYAREDGDDVVPDRGMSFLTVPPSVAWVRHLSWLNNERSRLKVKYQEKRWNPPKGNGCSYAWDDRVGLIWNRDYFERTKQMIPETLHEK